jgi:hypothetical protein
MDGPDPMSFGLEKVPDELAYECAEHVSRLFMSYGIRLRNESFDELEGIIQDYMQELADRLRLPPKTLLSFE